MKIAERLIRCEATARIRSMEAEKLYLQNLHSELGAQWRSINERIESINRQILAERRSVAPSNIGTSILLRKER